MEKKNFISYLLNPKNWWLPLLVIFTISIAGVLMIGVHTYTEAPPIPTYRSANDQVVFSKDDVLQGQAVFQKYALMEYGSMFGDGANRGPDFTAEALHQVTYYMNEYYQSSLDGKAANEFTQKGIAGQVKADIKSNQYNSSNNSVTLNAAQSFGEERIVSYKQTKLTNP